MTSRIVRLTSRTLRTSLPQNVRSLSSLSLTKEQTRDTRIHEKKEISNPFRKERDSTTTSSRRSFSSIRGLNNNRFSDMNWASKLVKESLRKREKKSEGFFQQQQQQQQEQRSCFSTQSAANTDGGGGDEHADESENDSNGDGSSSSSSSSSSGGIKSTKKRVLTKRAAISVTPEAAKRIQELLSGKDEVLGIRLGVKRRGCNGLSYTMNYATADGLAKELKFDDVVEENGVTVYIDPKAVFSIVGTVMDWEEDELSQEFTFTNPNAKGECGCGESFNV